MNKLKELLESNGELKAKIEALNKDPKATAADFIALVKEYGVELTEADFQPVPAGGEVSDSELEAVAGGGKCICVVGGGSSGNAPSCGCIGGGVGGRGDDCECGCVVIGFGDE